MIFEGQTFSDEKKNTVIKRMHVKKKIHWKPAFAFIGVIAIALLIWFNPLSEFEKKHAFTEKSLVQAYYDSYSPDGFPGEVKYVELGKFEESDAILITKDGSEDNTFYVLYYAKFENNKWGLHDSIGFREYDPDQYNPYDTLRAFGDLNGTTTLNVGSVSMSSTKGDAIMYVGAFDKDKMPERVIVGQKDVEIYDVKGLPPFWIEKVNSAGTPVYFVENHTRKRVIEFDVFERNSLDVIEELPTDIVVWGSSDMHGAYDTYFDYNVVVDQGAYNYNNPDNGDVVLLKNGQFARILVTYENGTLPLEVKLTEGTVLLNDYFMSTPYMMGHFNGKNTIYDNSTDRIYLVNEGQYFAKADNWANSEAFEGIIMKEDIVGKVKGYSLMTIRPNWPEEMIGAYDNYKRAYNDAALKDIEPKLIAVMQKYAEYIGDYRTMYELYADSTVTRSYEEWLQFVNKEPSEAYKQRLLYQVDLLLRSGAMNEQEGKLEHIHPLTNERKYAVNMERENAVWKVKYDRIINLNY